MTLNSVIAFILLYFTEFDSFTGLLRHSDTPTLSAEYYLPILAKTDPPCGLSAIAELLDKYYFASAYRISPEWASHSDVMT